MLNQDMKKILSLQNDLIKKIKSLHTPKGRSAHHLFIAEGLRAIEGLMTGRLELKFLFYTSMAQDSASILTPKINQFWPKVDLILLDPVVMAKISTLESQAGILAVFAIPQINHHSIPLSTGAVLAQISDPGNMGTLIRTTAAMGYETVVVIEGTDPWGPKVVQASAGALAQINLFRLSWQELLAHKKDLTLCALVVQNGENPKTLDLSNSLLVIGSEAHGLPETWVADCEKRLTIPMPGGTESLNAAIAVGIALYLSKFNL